MSLLSNVSVKVEDDPLAWSQIKLEPEDFCFIKVKPNTEIKIKQEMTDISSLSSDSDSFEDEILSSDDDDDLFILELFEEKEKTKSQNYFECVLLQYSDQEFVENFRISRQVAQNLAQQLEGSFYYNYQVGINGKFSPLHLVLIYLWFIGHHMSSFREIADEFHISVSSLFRVIRKVTYFVSNMSSQVITWPMADERIRIERSFRETEFPGVIGVIEVNHVKIDKPSFDSDSYNNRYNFYSIQLQVVCDHESKIRDVFVGFPGSVEESRVFLCSPLADTLQQKCDDLYLLGRCAYPCLPNLLTPFRDNGNLTARQKNYNRKLYRNRKVIYHCFRLLKQKFKHLDHIKLRNVQDIVHFIRACCVLHNLAIDDDFQYEGITGSLGEHTYAYEAVEEDYYGEVEEDDDDEIGLEVRDHMVSILHS